MAAKKKKSRTTDITPSAERRRKPGSERREGEERMRGGKEWRMRGKRSKQEQKKGRRKR